MGTDKDELKGKVNIYPSDYIDYKVYKDESKKIIILPNINLFTYMLIFVFVLLLLSSHMHFSLSDRIVDSPKSILKISQGVGAFSIDLSNLASQIEETMQKDDLKFDEDQIIAMVEIQKRLKINAVELADIKEKLERQASYLTSALHPNS